MAIDSKVQSMFNASQAAIQAARANNGQSSQGNFPPNGVYPCFIIGVTMKPDVFKFKVQNADKSLTEKTLDCITAQFEFDRIMSPDDPTYKEGTDYSFKGDRFQLVPGGEDAIPASEEGTRTRVRMSWDRFMGHAACILGRPPEECRTPTIAGEVYDLCTGPSRVAVSVKCDTRVSAGKGANSGKTFTNHTEYLIERLDAAK